MRQLKHHEQKLLRKVDFLTWKNEENLREIKILRRYHIQNRDDYVKYNKLAGLITGLVAKLKQLPPDNAYRIKTTEALLDKLYKMGLIDTASSLAKAEHLAASAFCRRRLPIIMVRLKMSETVRQATTFIEQVCIIGCVCFSVPFSQDFATQKMRPRLLLTITLTFLSAGPRSRWTGSRDRSRLPRDKDTRRFCNLGRLE